MFKKIFISFFTFLFIFSNSSVFADESLKITKADVMNTREIKVSFNLDIDETKPMDFKIENKENSLEEIKVESIKLIEPKVVLIHIGTDLKGDSKYDLIVVDISGKKGENIQVGVDGIVTIATPEKITTFGSQPTEPVTTSIDKNSDNQNISPEEKNIELNSGGEELTKQLGGENVGVGIMPSIVKTEKLPQTGPSEILLILFALLFAGLYFKYRTKKA